MDRTISSPAAISTRRESYQGSVFFDLTDMLEHARHHNTLSGITRTSLRIIGHLIEQYGTETIRLIAWHPVRQAMFELSNDWCTAKYEYNRREFQRLFDLDGGSVLRLKRWATSRYRGRRFKQRYHLALARLAAALKNEKFFRARNLDPPHLIGTALRPVSVKPGDTIVILGATWNLHAYMEFLSTKRREGARIVFFVHDLVPLIIPQHVSDNITQYFGKWLRDMAEIAGLFVTNSKSTKQDLQLRLAQYGVHTPIQVVPLAHQFMVPEYGEWGGERQPAHILSDARLPYVLCVGTIESRKNVWGLARVWRRLIDELGFAAPRLLLAGKRGWLTGDFDDLMRGTGSLGGHLRIVDSPSETELAYLYEHCLFTVFPSFYEGWGLPIGESLWFGKTCVTSKTSSMPEVGRDMCSYVDPSNLEELYAEVRRMIVDLPYRRQFESRIAREKLRTWSDVAKSLWSALTAGLAIDPPRDDAPEDRLLPGPPNGAASPRGADWESAS